MVKSSDRNKTTSKILSITLLGLSVIHLLVSGLQVYKCGGACWKTKQGINPFGQGPWVLSFIVMLAITIILTWHVISLYNKEVDDILDEQ
tara:strand:+ start:80 stop:349 length:270 start_codon:yes stop_codon:yes gene_type:complete